MSRENPIKLTRSECISRIKFLLEKQKERIIDDSENKVIRHLYPKTTSRNCPLPNTLTTEEFNELLNCLNNLADIHLELLIQDLEKEYLTNFVIVDSD